MNCLLLDEETFRAVPNFDEHYIHSLADLDYGLTMKRMGIPVCVAPFYAGICEKNDPAGTWTDRSLSRRERFRRKAEPKGAPFQPWFHFLYKNFGLGQALLHGITPYIRILLGR
jgi:GT2 family glycosyltransferase